MKYKGLGIFGLLIILILSADFVAFATEQVEMDYHKNEAEIVHFKKRNPAIREYYGEIRNIDRNSIRIDFQGRIAVFNLQPEVFIFCNGYPATWKSLLPVTDGAYFEAQVYINDREEVCLINGFYYGAEGVINGFQRENNRLQISLYYPNEEKEAKYRVSQRANLPRTNDWLREGQAVFVLYNIQHELRAIYIK